MHCLELVNFCGACRRMAGPLTPTFVPLQMVNACKGLATRRAVEAADLRHDQVEAWLVTGANVVQGGDVLKSK
jgi:hypothetical protein